MARIFICIANRESMQRLNCSLDEVSYSIVHTLLCPAMGVNSVVAVQLDIMPAL